MTTTALSIAVPGVSEVSALLVAPAGTRALYVLAHGAGSGMRHPFLERMAAVLADRGIGTLRYQFPYMETGSRRVDRPAVAVVAVRAAVEAAAHAVPGVPLVAGGKSFGGRMTSTAQSEAPLPGVKGLAFLGFPLHPPGRPGVERAHHLGAVAVPMLFVQGTRDEFGQLDLLQPVITGLGALATLHLIQDGDHSFKVPKSAGRTPADVDAELGDAVAHWAIGLL